MISIIGTCGLLLLLSAFIFNQLNIIKTNDNSYNFLNAVGAILLTYYAYILGSIRFIILESVWALFATYRLIINNKSRAK